MQIDRLSSLIADCATLRADAGARGDATAFKRFDIVALRLYAAKGAMRRGDAAAARAYAWCAFDILSGC